MFQQKGQGHPHNMHKQFILIRTKTECLLMDEVYLSHGHGTLNSIFLGQEWLPCHEASAMLVHLLSIDVCGTRHMQGLRCSDIDKSKVQTSVTLSMLHDGTEGYRKYYHKIYNMLCEM